MLPRDYRLHELNDSEFEKLVVQICVQWLGEGVCPFAEGKDGGRDGKFYGTANSFPSKAKPLDGHCVLQVKHTAAPDRSCSEAAFETLLRKEHPKIMRLIEAGICQHYIVFTNRKCTGGADEKLVKPLSALGLKSAHIVGVERLSLALHDFAHIRESLPNYRDQTPFRFDPDDLVDVIGALHDFAEGDVEATFKSAYDFDKLQISQKNKLNGVTKDYYQESIINDSSIHFSRVKEFLENPRNANYANLYHDCADELKQKIIATREKFNTFDDVFVLMYEQIQAKKEALRGKRRLITIVLHYMYCDCDIGLKGRECQEASEADAC